MSAGGPFRGPPAFSPPLRFGQAAVFGQGGAAPGLPFAPGPAGTAAAFGSPYGLGQAPAFTAAGGSGAPAGNASFSFKPPTNLGGFPGPGEASGGGAFAPPEFRFKAPESAAAAFKPLAAGDGEKGPAAPADFTFSPPFGFAPEPGSEAAAAVGPFSFSRPAAALGRPEEKGPRPLFEESGEPAPKGLKRKEERERSPRQAAVGGRAAVAPPEKRAVLLNRSRGGALFGRTLEAVLRSQNRGQRDRGGAGEAERGPAEEPPPAEGREPPREGRSGWR